MTDGPIALATPRLTVRMAAPDEADAIADYYERNRAHFAPWDPRRAAEFYTGAWWRQRLEADARAIPEDRGYRFFLFPEDTPGRAVGQISFSNIVRGAFHSCHLGFGVDAAVEGHGVMREGLERAIEWAFDDLRLHRIEANHRPENMRSAGLLRRLGFAPIGYARDYLFIDGAWRDHVITARINPDWAPPEAASRRG